MYFVFWMSVITYVEEKSMNVGKNCEKRTLKFILKAQVKVQKRKLDNISENFTFITIASHGKKKNLTYHCDILVRPGD